MHLPLVKIIIALVFSVKLSPQTFICRTVIILVIILVLFEIESTIEK